VNPKLELTIPTWALPREGIPIHISLNKNLEFSKIIIEIPECFEIQEKINITKFKESNDRIEIFDIGRAKRTEKDYFGIIVATKEPFEDLAKKVALKIKLVFHDGKIEEYHAFARIFRPLLEIDKVPDDIPISDTYEPSLPIHLRFTGFGDIKLRLESRIGGEIVSEGDSILDEIFERMLKEGFIKEENFDNKRNIKIDKNYVQKVFSEFREKFRNSDQLNEILNDKTASKEIIEMLLKFNKSEQEKFMSVFYKTVEGYLIKIITDTLNRAISDNLHVDSGTRIFTKIKAPITDVILKIFYKDIMNNEYTPLEQKIRLLDKRKDSSKLEVNIPLVIEHVDDNNAYKNVGEMDIGRLT